MFQFNQLSQVQIEITNKCQAQCPMCDRNINGGIENPNLKTAEWDIINFKRIFNLEVLNPLTEGIIIFSISSI